jgi:hypothetical protein
MTEATQATEKTQPELTITDLANIKNLIDVVTSRGVFKAAELSSVGVIYDKLSTFLAAATPAPTKEQQGFETKED